MKRPFVVWNTLHSEHGTASWAAFDGLVTVRTADATKVAQIGDTPPAVLAHIMLSEMARDQECNLRTRD